MRYEGQSYEIMTPFQEDWVEDFHGLHEKTYGYRNPGRRVQIVTIRLRVRGTPEKPVLPRAKGLVEKIPDEAFLGQQAVVFDRNAVSTQVFLRERLLPGNRIQGPAILCEYSATTVVPPFGEARVDAYGNVILEIKT